MTSPSDSAIKEYLKLKEKYQIYPVVVHAPYLPNLATSNRQLYDKSKALLIEDLNISEKIQAEYLVIHPGSYSENSTLEAGINNISKAVNESLSKVSGKTVVLLECVAGGGRRIGSSFEELNSMLRLIEDKERAAICLDTAHLFGAGHDLSTHDGVDRMIEEFDLKIGLNKLKVLHLNDSKAELSSRRDRHEHIGKGHIGLEGFRYLIKRLKNHVNAGILETPKDSADADSNNLNVLFKISGIKG